jgi:hypothetical protein
MQRLENQEYINAGSRLRDVPVTAAQAVVCN